MACPACWASRWAPSGCGAAATSWGSRGSCWSTCSIASGPTSSPRSRRLREQLSDRCVAVELPIGSEHEFRGVVDLVHMVAYLHGDDASGHDESVPNPRGHEGRGRRVPRQADGRRLRDLRRADGALPGGRRDHPRRDGGGAQEAGHRRPAVPGRLRRRHPQHRLSRAARPDRRGPAVAGRGPATCPRWAAQARWPTSSRRSPTRTAAASACCGCSAARSRSDTTLVNSRTHGKERIGQLLVAPGQGPQPGRRAGPGHDRSGRQAEGDGHRRRAGRRRQAGPDRAAARCPRRSSRSRSSRRTRARRTRCSRRCGGWSEEDPSLDIHRDPQTGETIVGGLSQMHVEMVLERLCTAVRGGGRS